MAMAIFMNAKKNRGYLKNLQIDTQRMKNLQMQGFLKYNMNISDRVGHGVNQQKNLLLDLSHDYVTEYITTANQDLDPGRLWKNYIIENKKISMSDRYKEKIKFIDTIAGLISVLCIIFSVFEYELLYYPHKVKLNPSTDLYNGNIVRLILSLLSFCLCITSLFSCYNGYIVEYEDLKMMPSIFFKTSYSKRLIAELALNLIHPIPYLEYEFKFVILGKHITYQLVTFLSSLEFLKLYHIYRLFATYSRFNSILSKKYCISYGSKASTMFAVKCELKEKPFFILIFTLFNIGLFLGLLVRFFEIIDPDNTQNFENLSNGFWIIYVALTTVGYGEMVPKTHIGRLIVVFGVFMGTFVVSLTIVAFTTLSNFSRNEAKSYTFLKKVLIKQKLKVVAGNIIINHVILNKNRKLLKDESQDYNKIEAKIFSVKRNLKKFQIELYYLTYLLNRDTFQSEDDKFLYLESRLESDIHLIKIGMKNIIENKEMINQQISLQKKLLNRQELLERIIKNTLVNLKVLVKNPVFTQINKNQIESEIKEEDSEYASDDDKSTLDLKQNLNSDKLLNKLLKNSTINHFSSIIKSTDNKSTKKNFFSLNQRNKRESFQDGNPFIDGASKSFLNNISSNSYVDAPKFFSSKLKEECILYKNNIIDEETLKKMSKSSEKTLELFELLNLINKK